MRVTNWKSLTLIAGILLTANGNLQGNKFEDNTKVERNASSKQIPNLVIELAIFYDKAFEKRFQSNPIKIQKFWEVVMYDLHLRFQTLASLRTNFRVTSFNIYKPDKKTRAVYKRIRNSLQDVDAILELQSTFQSWAYTQSENIPEFDIAILITGDLTNRVNDIVGLEMPNSICRVKDDAQKKWLASIVVSFQNDPTPPEILAVHISTILGAPRDEDSNFCDIKSNSKALCCILSNRRPNQVTGPKFFSTCTNKHLSKNVRKLVSEKMFCLDGANTEEDSIIDSAKLFGNPSKLHAYSALQQCQLYANSVDADLIVMPYPANCMYISCVNKSTNEELFAFTPFEGSLCGGLETSRCFRGTCVLQKMQLVNVATGKCLVSQNSQFGTNDKPVLQNCSRIVTQMLIGTTIEKWFGKEIYMLGIIYSTANGHSGKNLILTEDRKLKFYAKKDFLRTQWVIHRLKGASGQEFVLQSEYLGPCLKAGNNGTNVEITSDCSGNDKATRWKFVEVNQGLEVGSTELEWGFDSGYVKKSNSSWVQMLTAVFVLLIGCVGVYKMRCLKLKKE